MRWVIRENKIKLFGLLENNFTYLIFLFLNYYYLLGIEKHILQKFKN